MSIMEAVISFVRLAILFGLHQRGNCNICTNKQLLVNLEHGKMLAGHQMYNLSSDGVMQCSRFCLIKSRCKSFNFNSMTGECQLNNAVTNDVMSLTQHSEFIYSDISVWPSRLAGACEDHPCPLNSICDPLRNGLYNCVHVNEYCLGVPMVDNGFVISTQQLSKIGTKLDITCIEGYLPEAQVVCQNNGTWSSGVCRAMTSCSLVKLLQPSSEDGEYWLLLTTNMYLSRIYCYGMSSDKPQEFLSLKNLNYGIFPQVANSECHGETELKWACLGKGGEIWFSKIKLNTHTAASLGVFETDMTFANISHSNDWFSYGRAVDCYTQHFDNSVSCGVKGRFTINLRGTGWRISEDQQWETFGWKPFMHPPQRELNGTVIKLNCGGYAGGCEPVGGLFLTPYPEGLA